MSRLIEWYFKVDWDRDGTYTDESANLISANGQIRLMAPGEALTGGRGVIDEAMVILHNTDQRYNPDYAAGPLYAYLQNGGGYQIPAFLSVSVTNTGMSEAATYHRLITGIITIPKDQPASDNSGSVAQFTIRSRDELIREHKLSTALRQNYTEADNIVYALQAAGFVDGTAFFTPATAASQPPPVMPTIDPGLHTIPAFYLDDEAVLPELLADAIGVSGDHATGWFQIQSQAIMLAKQRDDLATFGVEFDTWFSEQSLHDGGLVDACLLELEAKRMADDEPYRTVLKLAKGGKIDEVERQDQPVDDDDADGAGNTVWLRSTKFADDMDRVIRRKDGRLTYIASDVAYHRDKFNRPLNADKLITVLGPDHHGYIGRLTAVVAALTRPQPAKQGSKCKRSGIS